MLPIKSGTNATKGLLRTLLLALLLAATGAAPAQAKAWPNNRFA